MSTTRPHKKPTFAKGHLMTEVQRNAYWSMFGQVCAKMELFKFASQMGSVSQDTILKKAGLDLNREGDKKLAEVNDKDAQLSGAPPGTLPRMKSTGESTVHINRTREAIAVPK